MRNHSDVTTSLRDLEEPACKIERMAGTIREATRCCADAHTSPSPCFIDCTDPRSPPHSQQPYVQSAWVFSSDAYDAKPGPRATGIISSAANNAVRGIRKQAPSSMTASMNGARCTAKEVHFPCSAARVRRALGKSAVRCLMCSQSGRPCW